MDTLQGRSPEGSGGCRSVQARGDVVGQAALVAGVAAGGSAGVAVARVVEKGTQDLASYLGGEGGIHHLYSAVGLERGRVVDGVLEAAMGQAEVVPAPVGLAADRDDQGMAEDAGEHRQAQRDYAERLTSEGFVVDFGD